MCVWVGVCVCGYMWVCEGVCVVGCGWVGLCVYVWVWVCVCTGVCPGMWVCVGVCACDCLRGQEQLMFLELE